MPATSGELMWDAFFICLVIIVAITFLGIHITYVGREILRAIAEQKKDAHDN